MSNIVRPPQTADTHPAPGPGALAYLCDDFSREAYESGLDFGRDHMEMIAIFVAALITKPFVVFSGLSGSGKTRLATALGQRFGRGHLLVEPVRPDWNSPAAVLGYENIGSETSGARHGWSVPRTLEFALTALRDPDSPYLLVLDEMNLAHVEQYFADVLSGMESGQPVVPNLQMVSGAWRLPANGDDAYLPWPKNLFLVGTVNLDETTYAFSPKVLDRATTLEFRVEPGALQVQYPPTRTLGRAEGAILDVFLHRALNEEPWWDGRDQIAAGLQQLHRLLFEFDEEFGHRVFRESLRFGAMMADAGFTDQRALLDVIISTKVLPKFEHAGVEPALVQQLAGFALVGPGRPASPVDPNAPVANAPIFPRTFSRLRRMSRKQKSKAQFKAT